MKGMKSYKRKMLPVHIYAELAEIFESIGKNNCLKVEGVSMFPAIRRGDVVVVEYKPHMLEIGDIVVFMDKSREKLVVHRIISLCRRDDGWIDTIVTKGDSNEYPDPPLNESDVIGKVVNKFSGKSVISVDGITRIKVLWDLFFLRIRRVIFGLKIQKKPGEEVKTVGIESCDNLTLKGGD